MGLVNINWKPSENELRVFGRSLLIGFTIISLLMYFYFELPKIALFILMLGILAFVFSYFVPKLALIIYYPWMSISLIMGTVISTLIIAFIYFILLTPVGLFFKMLGRDPLSRKYNKEIETYWEEVSYRDARDIKSYEDQF